jgi:hypothetical protein
VAGVRSNGYASAVWRRSTTAGLVSSRRASAATQFRPPGLASRILRAAATAFAFSARLRFPIWRSAQLTDLRTKFRRSCASRSMSGRKPSKLPSGAFLSCTARLAMSANPARLTNSSSRALHRAAIA